MIITAHGGALNTGRNSPLYFEKMADYCIDAIEVDIRTRKGIHYLAHSSLTLIKKENLKLEYAFEYIKKHDLKINCDVKECGLVKPILALAREIGGVEDRIMFTGSVSAKDIDDLDGGCVYLNKSFFPMKPTPKNVGAMKAYIDGFNNPRIAGVNFNYKYVTEEFAEECKKFDLPISTFTVDKIDDIARIAKYPMIDNITTNIHDEALAHLKREVKKC